jgi:predicted phage terminase large subunit-like protein
MFPNVKVHLPQDPGQAGKAQVQQLIAKLAGFNVVGESVSGSKTTRAFGWSSQINAGNAKMLRGVWNPFVRAQYEAFPRGKDDAVDAGADAFNVLAPVLNDSMKMPFKPVSANTTKSWRPF